MTNVNNDEVNLPQAGSNVNSDEKIFDMKSLDDALPQSSKLQESVKMFGVVKFSKQSPEVVVPMCWLKGGNCYWPNEEPSEEDKKNCKKPEEDWTLSKVYIKSVNYTYDEAIESLSEYTADNMPALRERDRNLNALCVKIEEHQSGRADRPTSIFQNMDDLQSLENALSEYPELKKLLCDKLYLSEDLGYAVRGMLKTLMSYELATRFTWKGKTGKQPFYTLINIRSIIVEVLRRKPSFSQFTDIEARAETALKTWLRNANNLY